MAYTSLATPAVDWVRTPKDSAHYATATRQIAVLLFEGFSLLGAVVVAEAFNAANELAALANLNWTYELLFLSATGGNVTCSSSISVWTDGIDARDFMSLDALFVAGGKGARVAARDERLIRWLRCVHENAGTVRPIGEGRSVLKAACINGHEQLLEFGRYYVPDQQNGSEAYDRMESMKTALLLIKRDLGFDVARSVGERVMPDASATLMPLLGDSSGSSPADKVRAAARWLQDNCQCSISVADAARVAAMSERNFLRRFKSEVGVTPSDYLLHARLAITCSLLTNSELPVDKIARRTGMGNGDRLAKIFRQRMQVSPTEYRMKTRCEAVSHASHDPK